MAMVLAAVNWARTGERRQSVAGGGVRRRRVSLVAGLARAGARGGLRRDPGRRAVRGARGSRRRRSSIVPDRRLRDPPCVHACRRRGDHRQLRRGDPAVRGEHRASRSRCLRSSGRMLAVRARAGPAGRGAPRRHDSAGAGARRARSARRVDQLLHAAQDGLSRRPAVRGPRRAGAGVGDRGGRRPACRGSRRALGARPARRRRPARAGADPGEAAARSDLRAVARRRPVGARRRAARLRRLLLAPLADRLLAAPRRPRQPAPVRSHARRDVRFPRRGGQVDRRARACPTPSSKTSPPSRATPASTWSSSASSAPPPSSATRRPAPDSGSDPEAALCRGK